MESTAPDRDVAPRGWSARPRGRSGQNAASRPAGPWRAATAPEPDPSALAFPLGFHWGVATSAHQVEGGTTANTWSAWELVRHADGTPTIDGGQRCGRAADHWERFDTDLELMRWLGVDRYRFSIEWSRVEPLPGHVDESALERYRSWCEALLAAGIVPMVTLHHFTEPTWTSDRGGFAHPATVDAWLRFVELCLDAVGDLVRDWITVNEPVAYVAQGWIRGVWPPGGRSPETAAHVLEHLLLAHARAYHLVHERDGHTPEGHRHRVGLAHNIMPLLPARAWHPADRLAARMLDATYNLAVPVALRTGVLRLRLPGLRVVARHPQLAGTQDFFGLNHYHRALVVTRMRGEPKLDLSPLPGERNDLGWTLEPTSLAETVRWSAQFGLPIVITEHGTVDGEDPDLRRRRFVGASLAALSDAVRDGANVEGYLHWSLLDNFEWTHGFDARCGLFRVDQADFHRTPTSSAHSYREIVHTQRGLGPTSDSLIRGMGHDR